MEVSGRQLQVLGALPPPPSVEESLYLLYRRLIKPQNSLDKLREELKTFYTHYAHCLNFT
jgi:hypothetical protein